MSMRTRQTGCYPAAPPFVARKRQGMCWLGEWRWRTLVLQWAGWGRFVPLVALRLSESVMRSYRWGDVPAAKLHKQSERYGD